jgi:hypothetical protein
MLSLRSILSRLFGSFQRDRMLRKLSMTAGIILHPSQRNRMLRRLSITAGVILTLSLAARAQVANDNIENRRPLRAEETITSTTTGCTVQPSCVDERLTGRCIEYHNDQWFEFRPPTAGTYYVNIGGQRCRDVRGVQLVVLTGTPCEPATYRLLSCTSFGTQDDLFITLPNLQAGVPYLLDIDGYLKDYCTFTLQVSGRARGLPAVPAPGVPPTAPGTSRLIELSWEVPDSLATATHCRVLRREQRGFQAAEIRRVPITRNVYGTRRAAYFLTDTLPGLGQYLYQVVAESDDATEPPALLKQQWVGYSKLKPVMAGVIDGGTSLLDLPLARHQSAKREPAARAEPYQPARRCAPRPPLRPVLARCRPAPGGGGRNLPPGGRFCLHRAPAAAA